MLISPRWSEQTSIFCKRPNAQGNSQVRFLVTCIIFGLLQNDVAAEQAHEPKGDSKKATPAFFVCIDPGHPSEKNDGLTVTNGLREVRINWEIATLLQHELENDDGIKVALTKSSEREFVNNERRAAIANGQHANLFLRLHADAGNSSGFTIYYPRKQGSVHGKTGPSPEILRRSEQAARRFHSGFAAILRDKLQDNGLHGDEDTKIGSQQGALTGSIFSNVPTVLVEMVFLTNPKDAEWIKQQPNQVLMAKALAAGVREVHNADKAAIEKP